MRRNASVAIWAATLVASAGCLGSAAHSPTGPSGPTGEVSGTLRLVGGPAPGLPRPIKYARVEVLAGDRLVAMMTTDERGRFRLSLPPGRYRFAMKSGPDLLPPRAVVASTGTTHVALILSAK